VIPRWATRLVVVELLVFLLATKTRSALLGALVASLLVAWGAREPTKRALVVFSTVLVSTLVALFASSLVVAYIERGEGVEKLADLNSRTSVWEAAVEMLKASPYVGHGYGAARGAFLERFQLGGAHNAFVEAAINGGLLSLLTFVGLVVSVAVGLLAADARHGVRRGERACVTGVFVYLLINSFLSGGLAQAANVQFLMLWVIVAWLGVVEHLPPAPERGAVRAESWSARPPA
jgi:O-antigen ligase